MSFDQPFDAIVGRFVLMYQDDPVWSLKRITKHLRANGVVAFQELDSTACRSRPSVSVFDDAARWLGEALRGSGARPDLGLEMHSLFLDSGLPAPDMRMDAIVSGAAESPVYQLLAEAVRSRCRLCKNSKLLRQRKSRLTACPIAFARRSWPVEQSQCHTDWSGPGPENWWLRTSADNLAAFERTGISPAEVTLHGDGPVVRAHTSCPIPPMLQQCACFPDDR